MAEPGSPLGRGVTPSAAEQLGIPAGTPVGAALIDAHAGGLGLMAVRDTEVTDPPAVTEVTDPCSRLGEGTARYLLGPRPFPGGDVSSCFL